jgi:hypothetical protein
MKPMVAVGNSPPAVGGWKVRVWLDIGDSAGQGRAAVSPDHEILGEELRQAFNQRCGLETHPCTHFVRQQIVECGKIGDADLHLDHDLGLSNGDLDHS